MMRRKTAPPTKSSKKTPSTEAAAPKTKQQVVSSFMVRHQRDVGIGAGSCAVGFLFSQARTKERAVAAHVHPIPRVMTHTPHTSCYISALLYSTTPRQASPPPLSLRIRV